MVCDQYDCIGVLAELAFECGFPVSGGYCGGSKMLCSLKKR